MKHTLRSTHKQWPQISILTLMMVIMMLGSTKVGWGQIALINENIQDWTARASYGTYEQAISAGTVNMVQCIVQPSASASGTGSIGRVQMQAATGILELPVVSSVSTVVFNIAAGGANRSIKLQKLHGTTWDDITTFSGIGTTGQTYTHSLNQNSPVSLRLSSPSHALYVHDIIIYEYVDSDQVLMPAFSPPPGIYTTTQNVEITSATEGSMVFYSLISDVGEWTEYTAPIAVNETTTIWAYATKDGMDNSNVTSAEYIFPVVKTWSGGASTSNWSDPGNWSPEGVPVAADDVLLDNSIVSDDYIVNLPEGIGAVAVATLQITPGSEKTITLNLPSGNTANPGLTISGTDDALVINEGGVFINSTGSGSGSGFELSGSGSKIRINNGGRYIHNTIRTHATAIVAKLSDAIGTEEGIFEFDVPGTSNYALSITGRTYGTLVLSSSSQRTYSGSGGGSLSVQNDLIIQENVIFSPSLTGEITVDNNFELANGATIVLDYNSKINILGSLTNNAGPSGILIKSDATGTGSLIHNTPGVTATVERYIPASRGTSWQKYDFPTEWFYISSPVVDQSIAGFLSEYTETKYDLYRWHESSDTWLNYKDVNFVHTNFDKGLGYLFASPDAKTPEFSGELYVSDAEWKDLSRKDDGDPDPGKNDEHYEPGWHLLGNPYASGMVFRTSGTSQWAGTNVTLTPKIWDASGSSFTPIAENEFIPHSQAFFVKATAPGGQLNIPANARAHTAAATKSEQHHRILLSARPLEGNTWQQSVVRLEPDANELFDHRYHAYFRAGDAPQLYSVTNNERWLVNVVNQIHPTLTIPFVFRKNHEGNEFQISLQESIPGTTPYLYDRKLMVEHALSFDNPYLFMAEDADNPLRFELRFAELGTEPTSIPETETLMARIFANQQTLTIQQYDITGERTLEIFDLSGRILIQQQLDASPKYQQQINLNPGVYMVRLSNNQSVQTEKIIITH